MYLVRQTKKNVFEISKFEDSNYPLDVYTVTNNKCNCPASWRSANCKHRKLVEEFKKLSGAYIFEFSASNEVRKREMPELNFI